MATEKENEPSVPATAATAYDDGADRAGSGKERQTTDLESQAPPDGGTMSGAFLRFLDHMHPMGPSVPSVPPSETSIFRRRIASVAVSIMLIVVSGLPFSILSRLLPSLGYHPVQVADTLISHLALAGACYFHFRLASLTEGMVILRRFRMAVRGGRVLRIEGIPVKWFPEYYWPLVVLDILLMTLELKLCQDPMPGPSILPFILIIERWCFGWSTVKTGL